MIGGLAYIAIFGGLLAADLPTGPYSLIFMIIVGFILFIGGLTAHLRRRRKGAPPPMPKWVTQQAVAAKWRVPSNWLAAVVVTALVGIPLILPATTSGQPVGILGIVFAGLALLISGGFLLGRIRSERSGRESAIGRKEDL
jgi:hypothetical protein